MGGRGSNSGTYNGKVIKAARNIIVAQINGYTATKMLRSSLDENVDYHDVIGEDIFPYDIDEALAYANPKYGTGAIGFEYNCVKTVVAYELLRRGFDVEAKAYKGTDDPTTYLSALKVALPDFKTRNIRKGKNLVQRTDESIMKLPVGARALVGLESSKIRHVIVAERVKDGVRYFDTQSGTAVDLKTFIEFYGFDRTLYDRIDDKKITNVIAEYVKRR